MILAVAMLLAQCEPASATQGGCLTAATQEIGGFKYMMSGVCSMEDAYFNKDVRAYPGKQLRLLGARAADDTAPAVVLGNDVRRDGGAALEVRRGPDVADRVLVVDGETGNVVTACESGASTRTCSLVDGSRVSSHVSLTCEPEYLVTIMGKLGENRRNVGLDGGCNAELPDGGCYMEFTALHGELNVASSVARNQGGWGIQYSNPVTDGTGTSRFFVDTWGGVGQRHLMIRAQFPKCPADIAATTPQTQIYFNGAVESTQLYAFDEHRWYFCNGTEWEAM